MPTNAAKKARVTRKKNPSPIRRKHLRVDALPALLEDFERRCAYCMQREAEDEGFKIDHFHPTAKGGPWTCYTNLYLSCDRCNQHKWDHWPAESERKRGIRYLDCCAETEYGEIIFEMPDGKVVSKTPAGKYHIRMLKLNRPDLVRLRLRRRELIAKLETSPSRYDGLFNCYSSQFATLRQTIEDLIPPIGDPPPEW